MLTDEQIRAVRCGWCAARPGESCMEDSHGLDYHHRARIHDAFRAISRAATAERMRAGLNEREEEQP